MKPESLLRKFAQNGIHFTPGFSRFKTQQIKVVSQRLIGRICRFHQCGELFFHRVFNMGEFRGALFYGGDHLPSKVQSLNGSLRENAQVLIQNLKLLAQTQGGHHEYNGFHDDEPDHNKNQDID